MSGLTQNQLTIAKDHFFALCRKYDNGGEKEHNKGWRDVLHNKLEGPLFRAAIDSRKNPQPVDSPSPSNQGGL